MNGRALGDTGVVALLAKDEQKARMPAPLTKFRPIVALSPAAPVP